MQIKAPLARAGQAQRVWYRVQSDSWQTLRASACISSHVPERQCREHEQRPPDHARMRSAATLRAALTSAETAWYA